MTTDPWLPWTINVPIRGPVPLLAATLADLDAAAASNHAYAEVSRMLRQGPAGMTVGDLPRDVVAVLFGIGGF
jgi:hypothetical protein